MSNATVTADAVESMPTVLATGAEDDSPSPAVEAAKRVALAAASCEDGGCVCSAEAGHVFGGLPYVLTVSMEVAGMPAVDILETRGTVGKVMAGPGVRLDGGEVLPGIRAIEVVGPTHGEIYRATAGKLAEVVPELLRVADEADAETDDDGAEGDEAAAEGGAEGEGLPMAAEAGCCKQNAAAAAVCPDGTGPLAEAPGEDAADLEPSPV